MDTAWKIRSIFMCNIGAAKEGSFLFRGVAQAFQRLGVGNWA